MATVGKKKIYIPQALETLGDCSVNTVQLNCDYITCVTPPIPAVNTLVFPLSKWKGSLGAPYTKTGQVVYRSK